MCVCVYIWAFGNGIIVNLQRPRSAISLILTLDEAVGNVRIVVNVSILRGDTTVASLTLFLNTFLKRSDGRY